MSSEKATALANATEVPIPDAQKSGVSPRHHDRAMFLLSVSLGRPRYFRDEIECILCESMHSRNLNSCRDWFCRGLTLFDIDNHGNLIKRSYGKVGGWVVVDSMESRELKKLKTEINELTAELD